MRRLLRIILWMVKGALLLIALAALVMWPVSCGKVMSISGERWILEEHRIGWRLLGAACWDGWLTASYNRSDPTGNVVPPRVRVMAARHGVSWRWRRSQSDHHWNEQSWPSRLGPLRWDFEPAHGQGEAGMLRRYAAPLWFVALVAGAWPLASIAFAFRRRIKRRRTAREGLCKHCGYDLRATPDKSGGLLAVCPECGKESRTA